VFDAICLNPIPECQNVKSSKNLTGNLQYAAIISKLLLLQGCLAWFNAMIINKAVSGTLIVSQLQPSTQARTSNSERNKVVVLS
jgi:hypothetical protein